MAAIGPLGAGELRQRVTFERLQQVPDGAGGNVGDWTALIQSRSARLTPTRGGEQVIAGRLQGVSAWDLWVVYDSETAGITTTDRVVDARNPARIFAIRFIADMDGARRWLLMQLELGVAS
jgi:head-tail adaptor